MSTTNPQELFETYLKSIDSRYTRAKRFIATEIFNLTDHFEVENFIDHLRVKTKDTSRATVYRTIKQILDAGLLQKISTKDGKVFYGQSLPQIEHAHIICNQCGKIYAMQDRLLTDHIENYCKKMKFTIDYQSIHIYGECKDCAKK